MSYWAKVDRSMDLFLMTGNQVYSDILIILMRHWELDDPDNYRTTFGS